MATAASATVTVVKLTGQAWIRNRDGSLTELHEGARIPVNSEIVTGPGAELELQAQNGMPVVIGAERELLYTGDIEDIPGDASEVKVAQLGDTDTERLIAALEAGQDPFDVLDPTAAVSQAGGGGDSGGGGNVSRLLYVVETTTPLSLSYPSPGVPAADNITLGDLGNGGAATAAATPTTPTTPVTTTPTTNAPGTTTPTTETPATDTPAVETPVTPAPAPAVNTAPVAVNDAFGTTQNVGLTGNILTNDRDADGDTISVVSVNGLTLSNGTVTLAGSNGGSFTVASDGTYTFAPGSAFQSLGAGATAITTVSYTITDPSGATSTATLQVTVTGTNDAPVLTTGVTLAGQINTDADTVNVGVANQFRDPDAGDTLTYSATGLPDGLSINSATGVISGILASSASQGGPDSNGVYSIVVTATDGSGANVSQTFAWTVSNPSPVAVDDFAIGSETAAVQGNLLNNDRDPDGDTITVTQVAGQTLSATGVVVSGSNGGTFTVLADGSYTFAPGNDFRSLINGESATTQITYVIRDADGATSTATLTVTVNGSNDAAVITPAAPGADAGTVTEDATYTTTSGKLNIVDPDAGQAVFTAQPGTAGVYGNFSIDVNGNWTYALNNAAANVQALAQGEQRQEIFTVTSADGTVSQVTITVIGTNDAAVIAGQDSGTVTEDNVLTASGTLTVADADAGQATFTAKTGTAGTYGSFSIGADGAWTYTLNNTAANVQALAQGEQRQEIFTVTSADGTVSQVTVTVIGTNDAAVIAGQGTGTVTEDQTTTASGTLTVSDADAGQATFTAQNATAGVYGSFSIGTDGAWTYTLNNTAANVQALAQGEQRQEVFTVTSADGTLSQVTVTVIGTNDAAVIAGQGSGTVTEDSVLNASGTLTVADADAGQATFTAQTGTAGTYGSFSIGTDGAWTYTLNNTAANVQALAQGEQRQEIFTVTSADGTVSQVTVTVIGTNDAAVIAGQGTGTVTEDSVLNASGTLSVTDADAGQATFTAQAGTAGTYGSFSIGTDGAWTYTLDNTAANVQALAQGEQRQEIFTVTSADGTVSQVTVTVIGTNDAAVIAGQGTGTVTEDQITTASGTLTVTDADAGQATFTAQTGTAGTYGSFSIGTDGAWTYTLNNTAANVQALAQGEQRQEVFAVTSADGTVSQITVTVIGTNDAAVIAGQGTGAVTEDNAVNADGNLVSTGTLTISDADAGQSTFKAGAAVPVGSTLGSLSIAENGAWTYNVANSAVQYLAAGQTKVESFTVSAADGTTTVVTVTITGTNDVPTFAGAATGTVTEDSAVNANGNLVSTGSLTISDADAGQSSFKAGTAVPVGSTLGSLSIAENGTWTYNVANSAVQYLAAGQTKVETFTVSATDGTTTVVTVTITGTNDVPTFAGVATGTVIEDTAVNANGNLVSSGTLTISDADAGQSTFKAGTAVPVGSTLGSLSIAENGTWTYNVANSAVQYLAAGQTKVESFTVSAADGTTTVVTVTITGTNDVPTFAGAATGTVTEDTAVNTNGNLVSSGTLTISDADAGQSTFKAGTAVPVGSTLGSLSIAENGTWTYNVANSAVQYLAAGQTKIESFTVSAADGTTTVVTVTITGTNDVPTFAGAATGTVTEDTAVNANGNLVSSGTLTISDADAGQSTFKAGTAVPVGTTLGSLSIAENGTWTYNVANSAVQYLAAGQTKVESFTVSAADGTTTVVTVTITGTNDVPTFAGAATGSVTEDTAVNANGNLVSSGTLTISDADAGQSTFKAGTAVPVGSTLGSLSIAENGTWTYNVANSAVQYLAAGQTKVESFTVSAADGTTTVVTVTITGTNDVPTFAGTNAGAVTEDTAVNANGNLVSSGTLTISDADAGQSTFKAGAAVPVGSTLGSLSIAENGTWTYNVANSAVQYLAAGQTKVESFTVSAADGTTTVVTVTITGTNDVPTFSGENAGTVTEDTAVNTNGNLVSSGTLTISDADAGQSTFKAGTAVPVGTTLGSLSIAENGTWTYNVANSAVQYLAAGQTKVESFTVYAADGTTTVVTVTITGTNDVPTFAGTNAGAVTEDTAINANGNLVSSGTLTISDADAGQSTFKAGTAVPVGSTLGSLSIAENGTWTYNVANSAVQYLAAGQTKIESFTVSAADGTTTVVTVTITGTNDVPTFSGANAGAVTEDTAVNANGNLVSTGTLTVSDADAGQSTFKAGTAVPVGSTLGSLSIAENGTWTYNVANSAVQYLAAGQTKVESFTVSAVDGTTTVVTVTITGTNDVPTFAGVPTGTVTEDTAVNANGNLVSSGTLTISDADAGQSTFKAGTAVPVGTTLGSLSIAENGTWTYNVANSAVQYLAAGQTKVESFTVSAADGTTTVVTVTITGTNDVPTFAGAATGTVTEDTAVNANGNLVSTGTLTISDADAGQSTFKAGNGVPVGSTLGSLSIGTNGAWTYNVPNSAVQYLAAGQTKVESFTVSAADGTTTVVTVTITGTNDVPTFAGAATGTVTEDTAVNANGNLVSTGTLTISDADAGQSTFKAGTAVAVGSTLGSLSIAENGTWTYNVANSAVQYLAAGQTKVESFTVSAADGTTTVVTVTITGTNDIPTFSGTNAGAVTEDTAVNANGNLVSSGTLTISDADAGQSAFKAGTAVPVGSTLGSLSIAENGTWTYNVANSAVQYLAAGQTKVESFTVSAADGTTTVVTVTITGTNDVPTFTGAATGTVTEDTAVNANGNLVSTGTLIVNDADIGQSTFKAGTAVAVGSVLGSLSIAANGAWTYNVPNSAVQYLAAGQTKLESFTVTTADGTTTVITVTITGTNDIPTFSGVATGAVTEDTAVNANGNLVSTGTLTISDADSGQSTFKAGTAVPVGSTLGSLSIAENGTWTYNVANSAVQYLAAGATKTESFTVSAADGTTTVVTVTITGTNDIPTFSGAATGTVTEDTNVSSQGTLVSTGTLIVTDADSGEASFKAGTATAVGNALGSLSIAANGAWTYSVANSAVQYLGANQTKVEQFTVQSADGTTKTISVTITGTNDAPIATADTGTVGEDNTLTVSAGNGVLANDSDIDAGSTLVVSAVNNSAANLGVAIAGSAGGTFTLKADGSYVFNPGQDFQALTEGATKTTSVSYTVSDGQGGTATTTLTVTVTGSVDKPTITVVPHALTAAETGALSTSQGLTINYYQGVGVNNAAYKMAGSLQGLVDGKTPTTTTTDGSAFDRNVAVGDVYAIKGLMFLEAGKSYTFSGYWDDTMQFKVGDTAVLTKDFNTYGNYQTVTIQPTVSGYYPLEVYMTNNDGAGRLSLMVGVDGGAATSITSGAFAVYPSVAALQAGALDFSPVQKDAGGYSFYAVKEDEGVTGSRIELGTPTAALTDTIGPNETLKVSVSNIPAGTVLTDAAGHSVTITSSTQVVSLTDWSLATLKLLPPTGFVGVIALNYTATAEGINGGTASASTTQNVFVFPLTPNAGAVTEDSSPTTLSATSTLLLRGADDQAVVFKAGSGVGASGTLGSLTIDAAGKWTYSVDNSRVQYLGAGETKQETFTVTTASNTTQTITVTVTGVNDVPTITGARTGEVTEDLNANAQGNLTATGALVAADADQNQSGFVTTVTPGVGVLGSLSIDAAGKWSYAVANSKVQYLGAGDTRVETFTVSTLDGTTQTISVTIKGTNDATVFGGATTGTVTEDTNVVSGKLTTSGVLTFVDPDQNQSAISTTVTPAAGNLGTLTISSTGAWTYSVDNSKTQYLNSDTTRIENFTVTSQDGTQQVISVTIKGTNDAPVLTSSSATVSEEGLDGGLKDTAGTSDTTDSATFTGKIGIVDVDNTTFKVSLTPPSTALTSGGLTVTWKVSSDGMTLTGSTTAKEVIKVVMDASGNYSVNLLGGLDHPVKGSEDTLSFNVGVTVNDGSASSTTQLAITVEDDSPIAQSSTANIFQPTATTNLLLMLDTSGSMAEKFTNSAGVTMTRLDAMKAAVTSMLDKYAELGDVRVQGVSFNSTAQNATSWMTVAQAKTYLTYLTANGGTNYDDALAKAQTAFNTSGKLAGGNNVAYFFSDGEPTMSNQVNSVNNPGNTTDPTLGDGIDAKEQAAWEAFLVANKINTFAVGMGSDVSATYLNPISYDGQKSVDNNATGTVIVSNLSQLTSTVLSTVPTREVTGGLGYDGTAQTGRFGGDAGSIKTITVSGLTYTYDATKNTVSTTGTLSGGTKGTFDGTSHALTITTALGGKFVIDMVEGRYSYTAAVDKTGKETFGYTLTDNDGDTASSTLTVNVYGASSTTAISSSALGLAAEYYGYNDAVVAGNKTHRDDYKGNLASIKLVETIINGRQGVDITGTTTSAKAAAVDATFTAKTLNYGNVTSDLGNNTNTAAGAAVAAPTSRAPAALYTFLDNNNATDDEKSLRASTAQTMGKTTDAAIRMVGAAYFSSGFYDFKITADDGYRLMIDGVAVLVFDGITSVANKAVTGVEIGAGFHSIELLYWDQGGNARLKVEYKASEAASYDVMSTDNIPMFSSSGAPNLSALQDIVQNDDGTYSIRTGQELTGSEANDIIQGTDGKDVITGGLGDDTIYGGSGDDIIDGGAGNDMLYGGTGADTLKGGEGNDVLYGNEGRDTLIGGKGDDILYGGTGSDTFKWELNDQGTKSAPAVDTIKDFSTATVAAGGDVLDLKDLLVGENDGNLTQYLNIKKDGANTVIDVSTSGNVATQVDQKIVLENVDLTNNNVLTNQQIINDLLQKGKLQTDH